MTEAILESLTFEVEAKNGHYSAAGENAKTQLHQLGPRLWEMRIGDQSYRIFLESLDADKKLLAIKINGKATTVQLKNRAGRLIASLGLEHTLVKKISEVRAPMPGLIHSISVKEGDEVAEGDPLLILEAMKMENVIKSPGPGVIANIQINAKDSVEKNALLISFA